MGRNLRPPPKGDANPPGIRRIIVIIAQKAEGSQELFNEGKRKGPQWLWQRSTVAPSAEKRSCGDRSE